MCPKYPDVKSTGMASKRKLHEATCSEQVTFKKVEDCELITNKGNDGQLQGVAFQCPCELCRLLPRAQFVLAASVVN